MRSPSFRFAATFIALFVCTAFLALYAFIATLEKKLPSFSLSSIDGALNNIIQEGVKDDWSSAADFLSAVIGLPIALAGSIVAIYIAHRAFFVSQRQADFEVNAYIEKLSDKSAETFWRLSGTLREIDELASEFAFKSVLLQTHLSSKKERSGTSELKAEVVELWRSVEKSFNALSQDVLLVLRDPISLESWRERAAASEKDFSQLLYDNIQFERRELFREAILTGDPTSLANELRHCFLNNRGSQYAVQLPMRTDSLGQSADDFSNSPKTRLLHAIAARHLFTMSSDDGGNKLFREADTEKKYPIGLEEVYNSVSQNIYELEQSLSDPEARLLILGSLARSDLTETTAGAELTVWGGDGARTFHSGTILLMRVISALPTPDSLQASITSYLRKNSVETKDELARAVREIESKNIHQYAPSWLLFGMKGLLKKDFCLITPRLNQTKKYNDAVLASSLEAMGKHERIFQSLAKK